MRRVLDVVTLTLLAACTQPADVSLVDPSEGPPGSAVRIEGEHFDSTVSVLLRADGSTEGGAALSLSTVSAERLAGKLPAEIEPGSYTLVVSQRGTEVLVPGAFTVKSAQKDVPCGHLYRANTQVSPITEQVVIDRFYRDGKRETVRVDLDDVEKIEFEKVATDKGLCSVIYIKTADGRRLRFADDLETAEHDSGLDLKARAYKLGQEISKSVDVTREDDPPETPAKAAEGAGEAAGG